tara:strand:+ start:1568 stop:1720 length:153 start_codon:yes stop_codon:yes gene_type:complete
MIMPIYVEVDYLYSLIPQSIAVGAAARAIVAQKRSVFILPVDITNLECFM